MRVDVQKIIAITSSLTTSITGGQDRLRDDLLNSFSLLPTFTSKMVEDRMEGVLLKHTAQIETTTTELLADQNARLDPLIRCPPKVRRQPRSQNSKSLQRKNTTSKTEGVAINVSQYAPACPTTCVCACHTQVKAPAPAFINRVLGQLFVGTAGVPFLSTKCDYHACKSSLAPRVTVEYIEVDKIIRIDSSKSGAYKPLYTRAGGLIQENSRSFETSPGWWCRR